MQRILAASRYENSYSTALPRLLQTLETGRTQNDCMLGPHGTQWRHLLCNVEQPAYVSVLILGSSTEVT